MWSSLVEKRRVGALRDKSLNDFLIIANAPYDHERVQALAPHKTIIVLDGAANHLRDLVPHYILGDFDSILPKTEKKYRELQVSFIHLHDQEHSDLEKAIIFAKEKGAKRILITSALGGERTDHTLSNLSLLKALYSKECAIQIYTSKEIICFLKDETFHFSGSIGAPCAFFGWPKATVSSSGLVWDVKKWNTEIGGKVSSSNRLKTPHVEIKVAGELLLIYPNS